LFFVIVLSFSLNYLVMTFEELISVPFQARVFGDQVTKSIFCFSQQQLTLFEKAGHVCTSQLLNNVFNKNINRSPIIEVTTTIIVF
jgi:hypothetical protein